MQHLSGKEKNVFDSKAGKTPNSPAKVSGSPEPWHGQSASPACASTPDQEEACLGNREASFGPQRPQIGVRKWILSPLNHARSLDGATRPAENALDNTSMVYPFPPGCRNTISSSSSSTSSSSLSYFDVSDNDMKNLSNGSGSSTGSPQLSPVMIGRLWEEAMASQEIQSVQQLIKCGFDVCGDGAEMQRPPLILAVLTGNKALVKLLLTAGADINCIDSDGLTTLHHAAAAGDRSLVKLLLVTGADLYARTKQGVFPMHFATDGPTYQLLSQRLKADMEDPTHSSMGFDRESSSQTMEQLDPQPSNVFPQTSIQTQESVSSSSNEPETAFDTSGVGPKQGPAFFRHGSFGQLDREDGLTNEFLENFRLSIPYSSNEASSNQDFDIKLVKRAEKKDFSINDNWISSFSAKDALDKGQQNFGSQNVWLQNLLLDKANSQDAAKPSMLRNTELNNPVVVHGDDNNAMNKSSKGSPQECLGSLSTSSTSSLAAGELESQWADQQTDWKLPSKKSMQERWRPMIDGVFKAQEDFLCASSASPLKNDQGTIADNAVSNPKKKEGEQATPEKTDPELLSSALNFFESMPSTLSDSKSQVKLCNMLCDSSAGKSPQQKQRLEGECVMPANQEAFKDSDHTTGKASCCNVLFEKADKAANSKLHEIPKQEDTFHLCSVQHDDSQMQVKGKKEVKFVAPSEADLALVRKDWHNAARAGCVGCGTEGCGGNCLPKKLHGDTDHEKSNTTPSGSKSKKGFKKAQMKKTKNFEWKRGELLGEGAYGKVFCGLNQSTGELMAVKQLKFHNMNNDEERAFYMNCLEREISLYKEMRHKHIVGYIDMDKDEEAGYLYIFLEYVSGGSIQSMLERFGPFSEPLVRVYTRQLLLGLEYLHKNRIVHRDIKGGNVLVDSDGVVKLADFGASKAFHEATVTDACKSIRGSIFWMAPEVIKGDNYGRHADIWSVGCTVIEMLTAMNPWPGIDNSWAAIFQIAKASSGPPIPEMVSDDAKDFLCHCFDLDPKMRPSASQLLAHPFVVKAPEMDQKVMK